MKTKELRDKIEAATVTNEDIALWLNWYREYTETQLVTRQVWHDITGKPYTDELDADQLPDWLGNTTLLLEIVPPSLSWEWALLEATTTCSANGWGLEKLNRALLLIIIVYKDVEKTGFTKT